MNHTAQGRGDKSTLTDTDRKRLAAATIANSSRIGAIPPRREFLQALAAGFLPSAWLARSRSNGGLA